MGGRVAVAVALAAVLVPAGTADAARLVTFTTKSRYVDPADPQITYNDTHRPDLPPPSALPVNVLLPNGYDGKRRFPVLFLLHGHGDNYNSWMTPSQGDLLHTAAGLPAIVVMPEAARGWYTNWWNGGQRGSPAWEDYHLRELVPLIRKRFKIRPERRWHAIAGLSMGGEGAVYYAEQRPGYFGSVASFSGVLSIQRPEWPAGFDTQGENHEDVYGDPDAQSFYWTGHNPTALVGNLTRTRVFVAVGDGTPTTPDDAQNYFGQVAEAELHEHAKDFVAAARKVSVDVTYQEHHGIHDWPYWRLGLRQAIKWGLFESVRQHPRQWRYSTVSRASQAWGIHFDFKKAPTEVESFERDLRFLRGRGSGTVTVTGAGERHTLKLPFSIVYPGWSYPGSTK